MGIEVSASILAADFGKLAEAVQLCERSGVSRVHIDVMDGHFVPNITIGPVVTQAVRAYTKLPIAAHLMIENPWDYIDAFADAGADIIAVHVECYGERRSACRLHGQYPKEIDVIDTAKVRRDIQRIKARGKQVCLVVNPGTPVECLEPVLKELESVLIMSVNPGFSGQKFIPAALFKVAWLRARGFKGDIGVDGGVNAATAPDVVKAGANVLITASYFFSSKDPAGTIKDLKSLPCVKAQTMLEYLLIMVVVASIAFAAFGNRSSSSLDQARTSANQYFQSGSMAIMGGYYKDGRFIEVDPQKIDGGWCAGSIEVNGVHVRECACPRPAFGGAACGCDGYGCDAVY